MIIKKILLIELSFKYNLPISIIVYIFHLFQLDIINYHRNLILWDCLPYLYYDISNIEKECNWFPNNKCISLFIKNKRKPSLYSVKKDILRYHLMYEIKILGEDNYLLETINKDINNKKEASKKMKIKYLNISPKEEIIEDYENFLIVKHTHFYRMAQLTILPDGDSMFN